MNKVVTIGLGYIGLPTSALMANFGLKVYGVDINQKVVDTINQGRVHIVEPDLAEVVRTAVTKGMLIADTKPKEADIYLIVVPTPFKEGHVPDTSYVESATDSIIPLLKEGDLYIIESTSPVGTTEKMRERILNIRPELKDKISIAYCPERVLPGNVMHELVYNDRVIGGVDSSSTEHAIKFYSKFVKGSLHPTDARTAEMCKLVENSSRDVQIAFANELSMICDDFGVDVYRLIELANKHPRVNILQPGPGVGGHCIAVDPWFLVSSSPDKAKLIKLSRQVNNYKTQYVINEIRQKNDVNTIVLFGLAFKPNIDDLRESPALEIAIKLVLEANKNQKYYIIEPNIQKLPKELIKCDNVELLNVNELSKINTDLGVILVDHKEFFNPIVYKNINNVLDYRGLINKL